MEEENKNTTENEEYKSLLDEFNKLKENTVSKDKFAELQLKNKELLNSIVNGAPKAPEEVKPKKDVKTLRKELFASKGLSNLEYITKVIELRDRIIDEGGNDPFLPNNATTADIVAAERSAEYFKHCIEKADGDARLFDSEFQNHINPSIYDREIEMGKLKQSE